MDFNRIISCMIRAAKLDVDFYEEVERVHFKSAGAVMMLWVQFPLWLPCFGRAQGPPPLRIFLAPKVKCIPA